MLKIANCQTFEIIDIFSTHTYSKQHLKKNRGVTLMGDETSFSHVAAAILDHAKDFGKEFLVRFDVEATVILDGKAAEERIFKGKITKVDWRSEKVTMIIGNRHYVYGNISDVVGIVMEEALLNDILFLLPDAMKWFIEDVTNLATYENKV